MGGFRTWATSGVVCLSACLTAAGTTAAGSHVQKPRVVTTALASPAVPDVFGPPFQSAPKATTPILHIVFLMKENRSFDQYFGLFPGADGATTGMEGSKEVQLAEAPDPDPTDPDHSAGAWSRAYAKGKMNGFDREFGWVGPQGQPVAYTEMYPSEIPNYWNLAENYGLGDHMFADFKGSSFANNLYMMAGQAGRYDPGTNYQSVFHVPQSQSFPDLQTWGCDDPPDTTVQMVAADNDTSMQFPCFDFPSLPNQLTAAGLSWKVYADRDSNTFVHVSEDAIASIRDNPAMWANVEPLQQYYADAESGNLPAVTWIEGDHSEHPTGSACDGENESVQMLDALMNGPDWASTVFIISYDEWGGFYDNVAPPQIDNLSYGFRVPLLVISPWVKAGSSADGGYISHVFYSFASIIKIHGTKLESSRD
jgi:phospholipase C